MRAAVYRRFGPPEVLEIAEVPDPVPRGREVLVRVRAAGLNPKDVLVRKGRFRAISALDNLAGAGFPRIPGYDFAGEVEALGPAARGFAQGQAVYGMVQRWRGGTSAELVALPHDELAPKPVSLSMTEAAAVPLAALTALQALRDVLCLRAGERVAIHGASGGVGTFAVQLARILGAQVTATASEKNLSLLRELGAQEALDYRAGDPFDGANHFDAVFDVYGNRSLPAVAASLTERGRYCTTVPTRRAIAHEALGRLGLGRERLVVVQSRRRDLETLAGFVDEGVLRPVIDRTLPLEASAEAHRHLETRHARGKVVLTL
jgi:NADPH:quinone reductase-like Zn-dependent oxidoreductase